LVHKRIGSSVCLSTSRNSLSFISILPSGG
jgi:hypothetical protein